VSTAVIPEQELVFAMHQIAKSFIHLFICKSSEVDTIEYEFWAADHQRPRKLPGRGRGRGS
jgi:hypothetical protein